MADHPIPPALRTVAPGDPRYQTLSKGFNQRWTSKPRYIQLITSDEDALHAIREARAKDYDVKVRGGGHCYEDFLDTDGVILDMTPLKGVYLAKDKTGKDAFCIEAGCTNWDVYTQLFRGYGVTIPAGSCYSVGAGGHISGGGYGLLSRRHGLTVDHLVQVDVVTVRDGKTPEIQSAHADDRDPELRDLFWAHTGGGGGNYGVILRYYLQRNLPTPPPQVWLSSIAWPWGSMTQAKFTQLLNNYGEFFAQNSDPKSPYAGLFSLLKLTHRDNGNIVMITQWDQDNRELLDNFIARIEHGIGITSEIQQFPVAGIFLGYPDKHRQMPWFQATMDLNGSGDNQRGKYKSAYMRKPFSPHQMAALWKGLSTPVTDLDLSQALVQVDSYGCVINKIGSSDTAVPQRDSIMKLQYQVYWADINTDPTPVPELDKRYVKWMKDFYADVYSETGGVPEISTATSSRITDGCYVNYPDVDLGSLFARLYYKDGYSRLQRTKKTWDPHNVFHHSQSIAVPPA